MAAAPPGGAIMASQRRIGLGDVEVDAVELGDGRVDQVLVPALEASTPSMTRSGSDSSMVDHLAQRRPGGDLLADRRIRSSIRCSSSQPNA